MIITFTAMIMKTNTITIIIVKMRVEYRQDHQHHHHHQDHHDDDQHGQSASRVRAGWVLGVSTLPHRGRQGGHWKVDDDDHHSYVDDSDDAEENVDDHDDLYIIGAVCLSVCLCVCLSQKSLFLYSRDFVVSHVYSYIPYSKNLVVSMFLDTFRIQEIWSFPCF